ncbi:Ku70 bridge and pillars domain-containing protein [Dioscorea alata]|uniref:Ku70 bridge and pillars domain-containing protein n=4 Tax=Dioscorea alata TaxID=55571 RepID=A0ACB7VAX8_DIOAL|nr:Ku70 bridge and pillars domain-containing protein [Dioscorea alata]KAH7670920.1 Ku70 bridge and pillars domain-containing protein [Dioscorea alata]KAH7670922.1 Ku70 bridge and pillars domain-containing protein [Dioscorea alata]KAH7670923.1 Ku70 bridge and pillars domain-containing protein [Dioscorea alata]
MASRTPTVLRSENFYIHRGKGSDLAKADLPKPSKAGRQERKALRDVSNTALRDVSNIGKQPPLSSASKGTISKEKSALRTRETPKNATNNSLLSDEEIKRCHEWAKEGIEQIHFTGNDLQKLQQDKKEQSVRKKVDKVTLALHAWSDIIYCNAGMSLKSNEDKTKMELEPEVLPPMTKLHSDNKELELLLFEPQLDHLSDDHTFELNPKDNSGLEPETTAFTTISIKKPPASGHKDPQA